MRCVQSPESCYEYVVFNQGIHYDDDSSLHNTQNYPISTIFSRFWIFHYPLQFAGRDQHEIDSFEDQRAELYACDRRGYELYREISIDDAGQNPLYPLLGSEV